jgi:hypothetical protein
MNTKNKMPGFTAENATLEAPAHYRTASVFDSHSSSAYVQPAMSDSCEHLWNAFMGARAESPEELVSITAWFAAGCN